MTKVDQEIAHAIFDITLSIETLQTVTQHLKANHKELISQQIKQLEYVIQRANDPDTDIWERKCAKWRAGLGPDPGPPPSIGFT